MLPFEEDLIKIPFALPHDFVQKQIVGRLEWQVEQGSFLEKFMASRVDPVQDFVPLSIWGDAVPFTKEASLFQVSSRNILHLPWTPFKRWTLSLKQM